MTTNGGPAGGGSGGGIKTVSLTLPAIFSVSGSPVAKPGGTFAVTLATQAANLVWAGPSTGSAAAPTFRALVTADIPATLDNKTLTTPTIDSFVNATHNHQNAAGGGQFNATSIFSAGAVPLVRGGTNADLSATGGSNQFLKQSSSGAALTVAAILSADLTSALTTPPAIGGTSQAAGSFTALTLTDNATFANTKALRWLNATGSADAQIFEFSDNSLIVQNGNLISFRTGIPTNAVNFAAIGGSPVYVALNTGGGTNGSMVVGSSFTGWGAFVVLGSFTNFPVMIARGAASQTANLQEWQNSALTVVGSISAVGVATHTAIDSVTAAVTNVAILDHTGGTTAAGFGTGLLVKGKSSSQSRELVDLQGLYNSPTDASYTTYGLIRAYYMSAGTPTARNAIGWGATGSAALIGFLAAAAAPVALQTTYTQTYTTTTSTVNPASTSAFTGQDNLQVGNSYAKVADLNTLRGDVLMAMQLLNQLIDNAQAYGLAA